MHKEGRGVRVVRGMARSGFLYHIVYEQFWADGWATAWILRLEMGMRQIIRKLWTLQNLEFQSKSKVTESEGEIRALREKIPAPLLSTYDRRRTQGKKGVALVRHGVCAECHMKVALGVLVSLMHGETIQHCGTCGRLLYMPEEESIGLEPLPSARKGTGKKQAKTVHVH